MRYFPFPTHIQIVCDPENKKYFGLQVPFQPWLSGQVGKNNDVLPMIPGDQLVVEVKTAQGACTITREKFFEIMDEVLRISTDFYFQNGLFRCFLRVSASGEVAVKYRDETAARFCSDHHVFLVNRLCIDMELGCILCIPQLLSHLRIYPEDHERLQNTSEQIKQAIRDLIS
jgi:hypothetical protein